jgi:putative nucleotidyltransferase with HDIG domain
MERLDMSDDLLDDASKSILDDLQTHLSYCIEHGQLNLPIPANVVWQLIPTSDERTIEAVKLRDMLAQTPLLQQQLLEFLCKHSDQSQIGIDSLDDALAHFGTKSVAALAFALILRDQVYAPSQEPSQFRSLWQHAVATAMFAKHLNKAAGLDLENAFIAGLLHDIGKPVVLHTLRHIYRQPLSTIPPRVSGAILEAHHEAVGRVVVESWELEDDIADAIIYHHDYLMAPVSPRLATLIHLADAFAYHLFTPAIYKQAQLLQHPSLGILNIDHNTIARVRCEMDEIKIAVEAL